MSQPDEDVSKMATGSTPKLDQVPASMQVIYDNTALFP